jgi:hypothetical protein
VRGGKLFWNFRKKKKVDDINISRGKQQQQGKATIIPIHEKDAK